MTSSTKKGFDLMEWLDERLGLQGAFKFAQKKQVPMHKHSVWYYMGGIALMLMAIQVAKK